MGTPPIGSRWRLVLACAVALASSTFFAASAGPRHHEPPLWASHCHPHSGYAPGIAEDLLPWASTGITEAHMRSAIGNFSRSAHREATALPLLIKQGRLHVARGYGFNGTTVWFAENLLTWVHALKRLTERWGPSVPDLELVLLPDDSRTLGAADPRLWPGNNHWPVMKHCKSSQSLDITIPIWHLYQLWPTQEYFSKIEDLNAKYPWEARQAAAYGGGLRYHRCENLYDNEKAMEANVTKYTVHETSLFMVRERFAEYLQSMVRRPDIAFNKGRPLEEWAAYCMAILIDGISCSSKLWQLMALGSVVLREQSIYYSFFDKRLRKWRRPAEITWAVDWVRGNEEAARGIAARAQAFVREQLSMQALECYWLMLLHQYARLLRFTPGSTRGVLEPGKAAKEQSLRDSEGPGFYNPVDTWLEEEDLYGGLGGLFNWKRDYVRSYGKRLELLPAVDMHVGAAEARGSTSASESAQEGAAGSRRD
ncbi:hypothetical protein HYH03_000007 [Edaphochlamys debaryana]|uniref:Glycosyl transferase CAP10 domain-containing protein n=1 Tax=Edaphochlamys debaryana TaxID=47281 RepID=A0A835YPJ7_9CHLO|nr:hypothetical protein HYH03_000007 [Edaphochlamys debaryana]|eukprot:KAG2501499.1 hypothetical protein HYH03_000007 [Edaphochlamys debaryana]